VRALTQAVRCGAVSPRSALAAFQRYSVAWMRSSTRVNVGNWRWMRSCKAWLPSVSATWCARCAPSRAATRPAASASAASLPASVAHKRLCCGPVRSCPAASAAAANKLSTTASGVRTAGAMV